MKRRGMSDKAFDVINTIGLLIIIVIILYPLIYVLSASISSPEAVNSGKMWLWPKEITFEGYKRLLEHQSIWTGYRNTIFYTLAGTAIHLVILLPVSYALSRKQVVGKKFILWYILFTMLFNGGLIPTYLVVKDLGLVNSPWAIVIPGALGAWSILVARAFFQQNVPEQLVEAAKIDGASDFSIFFRIALPLSLPIVAVMALFHGVGLWNQYFNALIYLNDSNLYPLQLILREILIVQEFSSDNMQSAIQNAEAMAEQARIASIIKYGVIIVSTLPLLIIYPFVQRFFVQGVLIGSVKE